MSIAGLLLRSVRTPLAFTNMMSLANGASVAVKTIRPFSEPEPAPSAAGHATIAITTSAPATLLTGQIICSAYDAAVN